MDDSFRSRWCRAAIDCWAVDPGYRFEFVLCWGVEFPSSADPGLNFLQATPAQPICEAYRTSFNWTAANMERLAPYRAIGWDVLQNAVSVDDASGAVWLLDWKSEFRARQFVNSGVQQLRECLLAFLPAREPDQFRAAVRAIDPAALSAGSFWWEESAGVGQVSERWIRECVTCMSLVVPSPAWGEYVVRVRSMAVAGVNLWDATEACAARYKQAEPGAAPDPAG